MSCEFSCAFTEYNDQQLELNPFQRDNLRKIIVADPLVSEKMSEWQLHLIECNCIKNLKFQGLCHDNNLFHELSCMSCEMNSNIWMCLQCGYLGCGRKY